MTTLIPQFCISSIIFIYYSLRMTYFSHAYKFIIRDCLFRACLSLICYPMIIKPSTLNNIHYCLLRHSFYPAPPDPPLLPSPLRSTVTKRIPVCSPSFCDILSHLIYSVEWQNPAKFANENAKRKDTSSLSEIYQQLTWPCKYRF